jgi:para-aminobenzoate synthetase component 1
MMFDPIETVSSSSSNAWEELEQLFEKSRELTQLDFPFYGGLAGYVGYEASRFNPTYSSIPFKSSPLPNLHFSLYVYVVVIEKSSGKKWFINHLNHHPIGYFLSKYKGQAQGLPLHEFGTDMGSISQEGYAQHIADIQRYIREGDVYQANFSYPLSVAHQGSLFPFYTSLRTVSPSPFSAYLNLGFTEMACSSPERFFTINNGVIQAQPIKGTLARSHHSNLMEFNTSDKIKAELDMITDLQRNDLGQVCEFGTVVVKERQSIEQFAQLSHSVSIITGTLKQHLSPITVLKTLFPCGSITGAPKRRAMEILAVCEEHPRSIYTGSIGYISPNGNCDVNVAIRTAYTYKGVCYFHTGGGIIADSEAEAEWNETQTKSLGFRQTLERFNYHG